jgi:hypothetical protein
MSDAEKLQALIVMAERLTEAFEADIAALKAGRPKDMRTLDPEIQKLTVLYGREAQGFDPARLKSAPADLRKRFAAATGRFRNCLKLHARMVTRVKNASEGLVKAIAEEVEKRRTASKTYAPPNARYKPRSQAMIFNGLA